MNARQLAKIGVPDGVAIKLAQTLIGAAVADGADRKSIRPRLEALAIDPTAGLADPHFAPLAEAIIRHAEDPGFVERAEPAPHAVYGHDLEKGAIDQMRDACRLPVAVRGALMPDAHLGYGLPIGGVLATKDAVIPYAVGVDIACRMRLSVFDVPASDLERLRAPLRDAIERETRFGVGASFRLPQQHDVLDADWSVSPVTRQHFDKARVQLGTSGSGNHFVEWGVVTLDKPELGLPAGAYVALLSHSGSRGTGAAVCDFYSRRAREQHPELPKELSYLSWLDLASDDGQAYLAAMNLMGDYAAANHEVIHRNVAKAAGFKAVASVENHHNFAWIEEHDGEDVVVHRKGATPAGEGVLGVIPGSMATPGYIVRGRGNPASLRSASHGAGRVMSRTAARDKFNWKSVQADLDAAGVEVLSAGIDEVPGVYKDIGTVMAAQTDLVDIVARFNPKIVKMAPAGERPED